MKDNTGKKRQKVVSKYYKPLEKKEKEKKQYGPVRLGVNKQKQVEVDYD